MDASDFTQYRPLMFSIAYRMTGSVTDAEDIVQEAFLRADRAGEEPLEVPQAYLTTITTRLAIDHLRSARVRRENYIGTWLPEPLLTDAGAIPGPDEQAEMADSLSMAFLLLLENLTPQERAVFLLREVFRYDYREIAAAIGKTEAACRQLFTRARRAVDDGRPRFGTSKAEAEEITGLFLNAANGGDLGALIARMAPDVAFYGDNGGRFEGGRFEGGLRGPVYGRERIAAVMSAQIADAVKRGVEFTGAEVNGQPGIVARDADGGLIAVLAMDVRDGQIQACRAVANPDKLRHLGPVSKWHPRQR
jgi:RNA polymerase sigma-70 factor (TIGR02957 family)